MKKIYIFGHNDLDGVGVQIIGRMYAEMKGLPFEIHKCNYQEINKEVMDCLKENRYRDIEEILVGDISVNSVAAPVLDQAYQMGVPVMLRDHHATAEWLNKYEWAYVAEKDKNGIPFCGTYLLAKEFPDIFNRMKVFIETVDSWDTWKWKATNNKYAKDLNALYKILGTKAFTEYILNLDMSEVSQPEDLFTDYARTLVDAHEMLALKTARSCEESMWVSTMKFRAPHQRKKVELTAGVVFCNNDISEVADYILDKHPELDFIMIGNLPRAFSFRTQKQLPIPLGEIANQVTGSGGGHPFSAGAVIHADNFQKGFYKFLQSMTAGCTVDTFFPNKDSNLVSDIHPGYKPQRTTRKSSKGKRG